MGQGVAVGVSSLAAQDPGVAPIVLDASGAAQITVPGGAFLVSADYVREGPDLLLIGSDGQQVLIRDFFANETPPDLISDSGLRVNGDLATRLAGPESPLQYAQAQDSADRSAGLRRSKGALQPRASTAAR